MREKSRRTAGGKKKQAGEPQVGVFWLVRGKLIFDTTPLSAAEPYGDFLTHALGHDKVWERLQSMGIEPAVEYDQPPRGRCSFNTKTGEFSVLADRCILNRKNVISQIKDALLLPSKVKLGTDPHYRCFRCLYGSDDEQGEDNG